MLNATARLFALLSLLGLTFGVRGITPALANASQASFTDCAAVTEIPQAECEALVALYSSANGAGWNNSTNWLQTDTPCTWYGLSCEPDPVEPTLYHVTGIDLSWNNLSGLIPVELGSLANLGYLNLRDNQLTGSIPAQVGNLANLDTLELKWNQLSGSIPPELGSLSNLKNLYLDGNRLTGNIPPELGSLANLVILNLSNNQLTGSIPPALGNLANLQYLYLSVTQLSGSIPAELGGLSNLKYLWLANNQLSGSIPAELGNLSNLWHTELCHNQLSGSIPPELGNLSNLGSLNLSYNQLTGSIPPELGGLANLESLVLDHNQLSGNIPGELGSLANLGYLYLGDNQLTGSIPPELGNLAQLDTLHLFNNQLTGGIPAELGNLANLWNLVLAFNQLTNLPPELGNLTNLNNLELSWNQLTSLPPELGNLTNLGRLGLGGNPLTSLPPELGNLTNLHTLFLSGTLLTSIPAWLGNLANLSSLYLENSQLTGGIPPELGNLTKLTTLWLDINQLTGSIPPELGNLASLTYMNLQDNQLSGSIPAQLGNLANLNSLILQNNQLSGNLPPELGNLTNLNHLNLSGNKLGGEIPVSLTNLSALQTLYLSCGLTSTDPAVIAFLDEHSPGWQSGLCVTTISTDMPDLSASSRAVNVSVTVGGGELIPTGTVNISGADTNCQATLSGGAGSCNVIFNTPGVKTLIATYNGDKFHSGSWDSKSLSVQMVPPGVMTNAASAVKTTSVTLNGMVNANGDNTTVTFEYGLTSVFGSTVTADQSPVTGAADTFVSKTITGLLPNKTYHFRVVAQNSSGATSGSDLTFTTAAMVERAKNGSFETYLRTSRIPKDWKAVKFGLLDGKDTLVKKVSKASVKILGAGTSTKTLTQTLSLRGAAGDAFTLSYWVKGSKLPKTGTCQVQVYLYNLTTPVGAAQTLKCPSAASLNWKKMTWNFTAPSAYTKAVIKITFKKASGAVWFDGISLMK